MLDTINIDANTDQIRRYYTAVLKINYIVTMSEVKKPIRFEAFHSALSFALQKTLSKLTLKSFISCFPTTDHASIDYVRKEIIKLWQSKAESEFQKIFEERNLKQKLDELDLIVERAELRQHVPDSESVNVITLSPHELIKAHSMKEKKNLLHRLESELEDLKKSNDEIQKLVDEEKQSLLNDLAACQVFINDLQLIDEIYEEADQKNQKVMVEIAVQELINSK